MPGCRHPGRLPLSGGRVVRLMHDLSAVLKPDATSHSGPSVAAVFEDVTGFVKNIDLVACVPGGAWPCAEFASRPRPSGQPAGQLVRRLCRKAVFFVPVGFRGSGAQQHEWRLSFSRHEYVTYQAMSEAQRGVLGALKHCRAAVGEPAAAVKSYYLKTALMWLCEVRAPAQWRHDVHASLLAVLRFVEVCVRHRHMPLYFWPEVNLLAGRSAAELAALAAAVGALRARLRPAALALLADWLCSPMPQLAQRLLVERRAVSEVEMWLLRFGATVSDDGRDRSDCNKELELLRSMAFDSKLGLWRRLMPFPIRWPSWEQVGDMLPSLGQSIASGDGRRESLLKVFSLFVPVVHQAVATVSEPEDSWLKED